MAIPNYKELTQQVSAGMRSLRQSQPDLMTAFAQLAAAGTKEGALDKKTRELVALGISVASRCDDCSVVSLPHRIGLGFHVEWRRGAIGEQVRDD